MTGLRTVGGGLPGPFTTITNLYSNPNFRASQSVVNVRTNLAIDPAATKVSAGSGLGWAANWYGGGAATGNTTFVTGTANDPVQGVSTFIRKAWTVAGGTVGDTGFQNSAVGTAGYPVTAGTAYTFSCYVRTSAAGKQPYVRARWYDAAGVLLADNASTPALIAANTWTRLSYTSTAPANAAFLCLWGITFGGASTAWAVGDTLDGTALLVEKSARLGTYFDGRTTAAGGLTYKWTGTADASTTIAEGNVPSNITVGRGWLWRVDPAGSATHRPNELTTSTDVYLGPGGDAGGLRLGMVPGKTYTLSADGMASAADAGEHSAARSVSIWYYDAGKYTMVRSAAAVPVGTTPARVSVTATIPATATEAFVRLYNGSYLRDVTWQNVMLCEGTNSTYFDGSTMPGATTGYRWTGTVDGSTSEQITRLPFSAFKPDGSDFAVMQKVLKRTNLLVNPAYRFTGTTSIVRSNLAPNPRATSVNGWRTNNGTYWTVSYDTTVGRSGSTSCKFVPTPGQEGASRTIGSIYAIGGDVIAAAVGQQYAISFYVRSNAGVPCECSITWQFLNDAGTVLASANGTTVTGIVADNATWTRVSVVTPTSPAGTTRVRGIAGFGTAVGQRNTQVGDACWFTDALVENAAGVFSYFDGATPTDAATGWTYSWRGTAHNSVSDWTAPARAAGGGNMTAYGNLKGGPTTTDGVYRVMQTLATNGGLWMFQADNLSPAAFGDYFVARYQMRNLSGVPLVMSARIGFYGAAFVSYGAVANDVTLPADGSWVDVVIPAVYPAAVGAQSVRLMCYPSGATGSNTAPGTTFEVRYCLLEKVAGPTVAANVGTYFDGATAPTVDYTFAFTGAANNSASVANP